MKKMNLFKKNRRENEKISDNNNILKVDKKTDEYAVESTTENNADVDILVRNISDEDSDLEHVNHKDEQEEGNVEEKNLLYSQVNEVKVLMESLQDLINSNTIMSKKISKDNSKIIEEVKGLKDIIIKEKDEEILEIKRTINSMKNKEKNMMKNIIHIVDQFDSVYSYAEESENTGLVNSMNLVMKVVKRELSEMGIEEINALGEHFSPVFHSCEGTVIDENKEKDEIIKVIKKGYKRGTEVIRPSKVIAVMKLDENN